MELNYCPDQGATKARRLNLTAHGATHGRNRPMGPQKRTVMLKDAIAHATLPAADLERAKGFWAKLGLSPTNQHPGGMDYDMVGGSGFSVYPTRNPTRGGHTQLHFQVSDIESEVADLRANGAAFEEYDVPGLKTENGISTTPSGKGAWFKDEDGNLIGVFQPK